MPGAWAGFFRRYQPVIRQWCARHRLPDDTCDDLTQDLILAMPRKLCSYNREADYGGHNRFRVWLRAVVGHAVVDHVRQRERKTADYAVGGGDDFLSRQAVPARDATDELKTELERTHRRDIDAVVGAVGRAVAPDTWAVFEAAKLNGAPVKEVAARFGKSVAAVYVAVHRVNRLLRDEYQQLLRDRAAPDEVPAHDPVPRTSVSPATARRHPA